MINTLYSPFRKWTETGTLWIYSDPHFSDPEMVHLRKNYVGDEEQIARINSKVGKKDTIIFLGDIGNEEMIRKIRGYKVLIMGNHDKGASKYQRRVTEIKYDKDLFSKDQVCEIINDSFPGGKVTISEGREVNKAPFEFWRVKTDNCLFDEVYEGPLFISDKLLLSHEPIDLLFAFNIHGHDHSKWHEDDGRHLNVCAEHIDYYPVNVGRLLKNGLLSKVESIHRMTIDRAVEKKARKNESI
jgi:calcineurin-like phosphoesterase family protein